MVVIFFPLLNWGCDILLCFGNVLFPHEVSWKLKYKIRKCIPSRNSNDAVVVVSLVVAILAELT
jgi:hypothetical protein